MSLYRRALLAGLSSSLLALPTGAQAPTPPPPTLLPTLPPRVALPAHVTTAHVLELPGRTLRFSATAGSIVLADSHGAAPAAISFIAYQLDGADRRRRPVTFALNGGPGSASTWLHIGLLGPWRLALDGAAAAPSAAPVLHDNAETWLDFTDLVFIDPVGTGYSRFLVPGEEVRKRLWSVGGDIDSIAEAIRRWLEQANRVSSPSFLVGESYGGFRGPRLARTLAEAHGVGLAGLVLVSPVLDFGGRSSAMEPLYWAAGLPTLVAAARGAADRAAVADAEAYAAGDYLVELVRGDADAAVVARRSARVAELTGLDAALVRRHGGRIDGPIFRRAHAPGRLASVYDLSVSMPDPMPTATFSFQPDAMIDALATPLRAAILDLYSQRLNWRVDAAYELSNMAANRAWDWGNSRTAPESMRHLRTALAADPALRVLVAHGLYDAVTPYFRSKFLLDTIAPEAGADRVVLRAYPGGHMFYSRDAMRTAFRAEALLLFAR